MPAWTRAGLRREGVDAANLQRLVRRGELLRLGPDRYAAPGPLATDALVAAAGSGIALRGLSAARACGLPVDGDDTEVLVRRGRRAPALPREFCVRSTRRWEVIERDGVLLTDLPRTCIDVARDHPLEVALPILDAALRSGLDPAEVTMRLTAGAAANDRVRRAVALADPRAESPLESRLRLLLISAGIPPLDLQHEVRIGGRLAARVDLWFPGVVVEADGFAFHRSREDYRRDRRKGQAYARLGLLLLRFSWEDVVGNPDEVATAVAEAVAAAELPLGLGRAARPTTRRRQTPGGSSRAAPSS